MKKLLILFLIFASAKTVLAQWSIGFNIGPTLSNYKSKTPWKEVSNLGYSFGATTVRQLQDNVSLHIQLQYIQKGYYHKVCNSITDKLQANYLEIPIMLDYGFNIPALKNFRGHANLGLYTAYWLSAKYVTKGFNDPNDKFDFKKSAASRFDLGPNVGGRIEYLLKSGSISLDCRYELGLLDMQKKASDNTNNTNRALVIGVSYLKPLGR